MAEHEDGLTLETAPLVPIRFRDPQKPDEEPTTYWVRTDVDLVFYRRATRWKDHYKAFIEDENAEPPSYDELYRLAGQVLKIEPEQAAAYGWANCAQVILFLLTQWGNLTTGETPSPKPSRSQRRQAASRA